MEGDSSKTYRRMVGESALTNPWDAKKAGLKMKLTFVKPRQELQPYIKSLWVFESAAGMPQTDTSLAVPNGSPKLIILHENSLKSVVEGRVQVSGPGLYFVGNRDVSALIRSSPPENWFHRNRIFASGWVSCFWHTDARDGQSPL